MESTGQVKYRKSGGRKRGRPIVLIGFMGSGKSTVGPQLARLCGLPFADLDLKIEARAGRSIARIFKNEGEPRFRALETAELGRRLRKAEVIAAGGGLLKAGANRALLRKNKAVVIWLNVSWREIWLRLRRARPGQRPVLWDEKTGQRRSEAHLRALWRDRCVQYRQVAAFKIRVGAAEQPRQTARRAHARLRAQHSVPK